MPRYLRPASLIASLALALLALTAAGCGGDKKTSSASTTTAATTDTQPTITQTIPKPKLVKPPAGEAKINERPDVPKGKGSPPNDLVIEDLIAGKGRAARSGDLVSVQYSGVLFDNGKEFDSSWANSKKPFKFQLGTGGVITGWEEGVPGMKVGGRRKLIIPAALAYGAQGSPPAIPPNAPLIFDIDLEKIS